MEAIIKLIQGCQKMPKIYPKVLPGDRSIMVSIVPSNTCVQFKFRTMNQEQV